MISTISLDPASRSERETWINLQRELKDIGISALTINDNKQFIVAWFQEAINRGELEEDTNCDDMEDDIECGELEENTNCDDMGGDIKCGELEEDTFYDDMGDDTRLPQHHRSDKNCGQNQTNADHGRPSSSLGFGHLFSQSSPPAQSVVPERISVPGIGPPPTRSEHVKHSVQSSSHQRKVKRSGISSLLDKLRSKDTLLFKATDSQNSDEVTSLLTEGASVAAKFWLAGETPLHRAVMVGHDGIIKSLCHQGAATNARTHHNQTSLHFVSKKTSGEAIHVLLKFGADIEAVDDIRTIPLHRASRWGNVACIQSLLESGANVNAKSATGSTALHLSVYRDSKPETINLNAQCTNLLLEHDANVNARNYQGLTAWQVAMRGKKRNAACLRLLKEYGAKTTSKSSE